MEMIIIIAIIALAFIYLSSVLRRSLLNIRQGTCSKDCTGCTMNKKYCDIDRN